MIQVRVNGLKETTQFVRSLPTQLDKNVKKDGMIEIAKNLQRRMKRRVRVNSGWLKRSIIIEKEGGFVKVVVNAYYGMAEERGSKPRYIPKEYLEQHKRFPESPGKYISNYKGPYVKLSGKAHPFTKPSLDSLRPKIPTILNKHVRKAITSAGGKL